MELKHLTDYELYTGLQLFPVQAAGVYPIVWSCPGRVCTCFAVVFYVLSRPGFTYNPTGAISIPFIIPTGFIALSESESAETELD